MTQEYFKLVNFGGFCIDYDPYAPVSNNSAEEVLTSQYEFEFYFEDWEGSISINKIPYPIKNGYFSCSKPGQLHKINRPYRCYFFNMTVKDPHLQKALNALPDYAPHPEIDQIVSMCKDMLALPERTTLAAQLQQYGTICNILSLLLREQYSVPNATDVSVLRYQTELLQASEYIRTHLSEEIDLEKLAKDSHLHPTYFHKLFRLAYAETPVQYQLKYRLFAAEDMLKDGRLSLAEIASKCGFSSQNYFSYKFKESRHITPTEYRKKFKKGK